jgi:hypothetical protein
MNPDIDDTLSTPVSSSDDYNYDPASSPRGNLISSDAGLGLALFFAFFVVVSVCGMCIVKLRNRRAEKRKLKGQQLYLEDGGGPRPKTPCSPESSPSEKTHLSDKHDPFLISGEDDSFACEDSPAVAVAARPTIRGVNESQTSVNNFSRPGVSRNGSDDTVVKIPCSQPTLELGDLGHSCAKGGITKLSKSPSYNALYHHASYPYNRALITSSKWPSPLAVRMGRT